MFKPDSIKSSDFTYDLPDYRIAQFPLKNRDASKLLVLKNNSIQHDSFANVSQYLPNESLIIFNNTRVVRARLLFKKDSGSIIEIFCLEPHKPAEIQTMFQQKGFCEWKCLVGNNKRWKDQFLSMNFPVHAIQAEITAEKIFEENGIFTIRFSWNPSQFTFAEVLEHSGHIPLPPYMKRSDTQDDILRYQTIYAQHHGSVAAPTAGLHFTEATMQKLKSKNIHPEYLTLHVGAGTFKPLSSANATQHIMHAEPFIILKSTIESLIKNSDKHWTVVGTTSARTLESLYCIGVKIIQNKINQANDFFISQWEPYEIIKNMPTRMESLKAVIDFMNQNNCELLRGSTQIMIVPGYRFKMCDALVTNFHQPASTLLLLVSALIGNKWKNVYEQALSLDYRFLSYGDCCLFFPHYE